MITQLLADRDPSFPFRSIDFMGTDFQNTDLPEGSLIDILNSIKRGDNIWLKLDGTPMIKGIGVYNKELLPGTFVVAFNTEEARDIQVEANKQLENIDTRECTLPDITTFFEIEKDGKKLYCYVVDRMDMWKHKKDMLDGRIDHVSIDGLIVYPSGFQNQITKTGEEVLVQQTSSTVDGIIQPKE